MEGKLTFLSFLYQVNVASGLPPVDTHKSFCMDPAGIIDPSTYPVIIGADGGSINIKSKILVSILTRNYSTRA